jgi:tetratricopeptide (TPR) repeat protein
LWLAVWGYYVMTLLPVLGIVQVGLQSMADRYMYLPSLGPFIIMGLMAAWVRERINNLERRNLIAGFLAVAASILVFTSLSYLSFRQIGIWKNSIIFWNYIIEKEPERVLFAYLNRGVAFENKGELNKAIEDYEKVIDIDPLYFEAYNNLGVLYGQNGLFDRAIEYFNKSIGIDPAYVDAYVNRGIAYAVSGRYDSALKDFDKAVLLDQNSAEAYFNRGSLYLKTGNRERAASDFRKACDLGKQDACSRSALY